MDKNASHRVQPRYHQGSVFRGRNGLPEYFSSLPTSLGGKRRLADLIFASLAEALPQAQWRSAVFADAFCGGGAVSLAAKARGFRVLSNDRAYRAVAVARALIQNDHVRLSEVDVARLLTAPTGAYPRTASLNLVPKVLREDEARFVDVLLAQARTMDEPKRSLALVVIIKLILRLHPMSAPTATDAIHANLNDFDHISNARLGHYVRARSYLHPRYIASLVSEVNAGVMPGRGEARQGDAIEFLLSISADVAYLDPPYAGTTGYEREYAPIDLLLGDELAASRFSSRTPPLAEIVDACSHIPVVVMSYGNAALSKEEVREIVSAGGRDVTKLLEVPYQHLRAVASREKNRINKEVIIVATKRA